ncbi:MAG: cold shock domain-containing protein [Nakamurella sp.]
MRRPELAGVRREGTVRWYRAEKGYGRITADDGEILFFHYSEIVGSGYRSLVEGQRVSFVRAGIADFGRGAAYDVRRLD